MYVRTSRLAAATALGSPDMYTSSIAFSLPSPFSISMVTRALSLSLSMLEPPRILSWLATSGGIRTTARRARSSLTLSRFCLQAFPRAFPR